MNNLSHFSLVEFSEVCPIRKSEFLHETNKQKNPFIFSVEKISHFSCNLFSVSQYRSELLQTAVYLLAILLTIYGVTCRALPVKVSSQ